MKPEVVAQGILVRKFTRKFLISLMLSVTMGTKQISVSNLLILVTACVHSYFGRNKVYFGNISHNALTLILAHIFLKDL